MIDFDGRNQPASEALCDVAALLAETGCDQAKAAVHPDTLQHIYQTLGRPPILMDNGVAYVYFSVPEICLSFRNCRLILWADKDAEKGILLFRNIHHDEQVGRLQVYPG